MDHNHNDRRIMTDRQEPLIAGEPTSTKHRSGWWLDDYGILGPYQPGKGPRSDPRESFPTGPAVGEAFPDIVAVSQTGTMVDVHSARGAGPAVVVFSRATLW